MEQNLIQTNPNEEGRFGLVFIEHFVAKVHVAFLVVGQLVVFACSDVIACVCHDGTVQGRHLWGENPLHTI